MQPTTLILNVNSENPKALTAFYRDVVQLPREEGMGETAFKVADNAIFIIDGHDLVHGKAKEPPRFLVNFMVDDLSTEQARLEAAGVACHRVMGREPWGGVISTFIDPDGNYFQLMEYIQE